MTTTHRVTIRLPNILCGHLDNEETQVALNEFLRRANNHGIFMELGSPRLPDQALNVKWFERWSYIDENRVAGHMSNVSIDYDNHQVIADVRPFGPYRDVFPHVTKENSNFTISPRALVIGRTLKRLVGFDVTDTPDQWLKEKLAQSGTGREKRDYFSDWTGASSTRS